MAYPLFHPSCGRAPAGALTAGEFAAEFPAESRHVEFKVGVSRDRIAEAAVAFSNADGGVILVGVSNDGTVPGVELGVDGETRLRNTLGGVRDLGPHRIHRLDVDGRTVVAIGVGRRDGGFAQLPGGAIKERRGASNHTLLGAELADFIARRFVRTVEAAPTSLRAGEIDPDLAQALARSWDWPVEPDAPPEAFLDRLRDGGFVVRNGAGDFLTVAGALYLLADPARVLGKAFVEVFRYPRRRRGLRPSRGVRRSAAAASRRGDRLRARRTGLRDDAGGRPSPRVAPAATGGAARGGRQRRGAPVLRAGGHRRGGPHRDPPRPGRGALAGRAARGGCRRTTWAAGRSPATC